MSGATQILDTEGEAATVAVGRALGVHAQPGDVFLLDGPVGVGKSVLARGLALGLGVRAWRGSPTFNLIHEYAGRLPFYHLDLYRLEGAEVMDLDIEGMLAARGVVAVEWGARLAPYVAGVPSICPINVSLAYGDPEPRRIQIRR